MPAKDPYRVLGVSRGASEEEIRKSYRRLVREHHPDANPGDPGAEERFKEIQHAYETLSDPGTRRQYEEGSRPSSGRPRARRRGGAGRRTVRAESLSDFFDKLGELSYRHAGGHREFSRELRGEDLARFARLLGIPLDRVLRSAGGHAGGSVSFGGGGSGAASAQDEKPPVADKPPVPPKPPKTAKPDDFS